MSGYIPDDAELDAELTVSQLPEGKNRFLRVLLITFYVIFSVAYCLVFTVPVKMPQLIAGLPIFLRILYLCTFRFAVWEYQTTVKNKNLRVYRLYPRRKKAKMKEICWVPLESAEKVLPFSPTDSVPDGYRIVDARGSRKATDACALYFCNEAGEKICLLIRTTEKIRHLFLRYCPPVTVAS